MHEAGARNAIGAGDRDAMGMLGENRVTNIRYAKGNLMLPCIALQMPAFLSSIAAERTVAAEPCWNRAGIHPCGQRQLLRGSPRAAQHTICIDHPSSGSTHPSSVTAHRHTAGPQMGHRL